jgi:hypothetical protein
MPPNREYVMQLDLKENIPAGSQVAYVKITHKYSFQYLAKMQEKSLIAGQDSINIQR